MGIFESAQKQANKYLNQQGIDNVGVNADQQVAAIKDNLSKSGLMKWLAKSGGQIDGAKLGAQQALIEQNWIIIKQNNAILDELKKLNAK